MTKELLGLGGRGRTIFGVLLLFVLSACGSKSSPQVTTAPPMVAKGAGQRVSQALFAYSVQKRPGHPPDKADAGLKHRLLEDLIAIEAAALAEEQPQKPNTKQEGDLARLEIRGKAAE